MKLGYKFMHRTEKGELRSGFNDGGTPDECWRMYRWKRVDGEIQLCENGFHCMPMDAKNPDFCVWEYRYASSILRHNVLAIVEYCGDTVDKHAPNSLHFSTDPAPDSKIAARCMRVMAVIPVPAKARKSIETLRKWFHSRGNFANRKVVSNV